MAIIKCKMCGGDIELSADKTYGVCEFCGSTTTFPRIDDDHRANLFNRANHFRRQNEFDKAVSAYERILETDNADAEAHWGVVISRFGIEYVVDPASGMRIPTCHRVQSASILTDADYLAALEYAPDAASRSIYEAQAHQIAEIQKGILAISAQEKPCDVFICYKESAPDGSRTKDSTLAQDIYYQLKQEGFNVFFSRITLEDKLGQQYEPYIFAALNSAKVMLVVGTKPEYFNAVWVKNEWGRYLSLMKQDHSRLLIPCYRDMDPYELPDELSALQSQDMGRIGFMQDLIRGVKKVLSASKPQPSAPAPSAPSPAGAVAPLLRRAFMFLEDGDWNAANEYCEKVLDMEPENAEAYLGKLMAVLQARKREELPDLPLPFDRDPNYQKVLRFGDEKLKAELQGYIQHINTRNENARLEGLYREAYGRMKNARTRKDFLRLFSQFKSIEGYKDSAALAAECAQIAEQRQKEETYDLAINAFRGGLLADFHNAQRLFRSIPGWKDADQMAEICVQRIAEWEAREAARKLEHQRREKERLRKQAEQKRKKKKILLIASAVAAVIIVILCIINYVIIPNNKYSAAITLMNQGKYSQAITSFEELNGYKDSKAQITACKTAILDEQYQAAVALMNESKYSQAITAFEELNGYKDSKAQITACKTAILDEQYQAAVALMNQGKYSQAITAFEELNGYKDSKAQIAACETAILDEQYQAAVALMNQGKYSQAITAFEELNGYKDSKAQIAASETAILDNKYDTALTLMNTGKYADAYDAFLALGQHKDSAAKASSLYTKVTKEKLAKAVVGDYVTFGAYEQDNNPSNGKEAIEWLVLARENNRLLVISRYALDCKPYNKRYKSVTWETCTLRTWLNQDFLNAAFSSAEQAMIPTMTVTAHKNPDYSTNPGNATQDKIFLLSITEAEKYFSSDSAMKCKPTAYAKTQSAWTDYDGFCSWWLRSPGEHQLLAAYVYNYGGVRRYGDSVNTSDYAVRPALWLNLNP